MGVWKSRFSLARRSIRKIWLKELHYFRSNHPLFILIFIATFLGVYNFGWHSLPKAYKQDDGNVMRVFDNFRLTKHNFVRLMICIPTNVVDYRFSTVNDAMQLSKLDFPDLIFVDDWARAKKALRRGEIDILVHFTVLIETGKRIEYSIISRHGDLNKHHCINCKGRRKKSWMQAIEAQQITNRFLYWLIKARGQVTRRPHWQLSHVYVEGVKSDSMYAKRQSDLFILWLILLPICARLIDSWNDDRKSGIYRNLVELGVRRYEYFIAKFQIWFGISLFLTLAVFIVNISVTPSSFSNTFIPFVIIYAACIVSFTIFLATVFNGMPFVAKIVGLLLMAFGEFGFGNTYHGLAFFQLSVRFYGKSFGDAYWIDTIALLCMIVNCMMLQLLALYLDVFQYPFSEEHLPFWYPLAKSYWCPTQRKVQLDEGHGAQILFRKGHPKDPRLQKTPKKKFPLVTLYGVCKRVHHQWVVNRLTLSVRSDEILTLYGHRGCGSEHILKMVSGAIRADYGEVRRECSVRELVIGTATEVPRVNYLNVKQYLKMVSEMRSVELEHTQLEEILADLGLSKVEKLHLNLLSTTQQERLRIAAAFVGAPDVVLIDWPTKESLPHYKFQILRFIEKMKVKRSIVIATYDAETTESISDRIVLLSEGFVVLNGACDTFMRSISSVFEIRLWPLSGFSVDQIRAILLILTNGDVRIRRDVKFFETPNGKLRITFPIAYRKSIVNALKRLEKHAEEFEIAFCELGTPNIHDVYSNACYNEKQYAMLTNFEQYQKLHAEQKPIGRKSHFFSNLIRIFKDRTFLYQMLAVFGLFVLFALLTLTSHREVYRHHTHEISLHSHDHPITIFCEQCRQEPSPNVHYERNYGKGAFLENTAHILWRDNTSRADKELVVISRGDDTFTMIMQNFGISQLIEKMTGRYPSIVPTLESEKYRESSAKRGFSMIFKDVNRNQAAIILADSYPLMYFLGVCQTFLFVFSIILPLRLVQVNLTPNSHLFPWPRYLYFGLVFLAHILFFSIFATSMTMIMIWCGYFATNTVKCFFRFLASWLAVYISTLPLIYGLVFSVTNTLAIFPTVIAISTFLVSLPNMISSFSAENAVSLETVLRLVSWTSMASPPTALQVLAAFLDTGHFHEEHGQTINALTIACFAHLWMLAIFALAVFQPGFARFREYIFIISTALHSNFERGTTLPPSALIRNTFVFGKNDITPAMSRATEHQVDNGVVGVSSETPNLSEEVGARSAGGKDKVVEQKGKVQVQVQGQVQVQYSTEKPKGSNETSNETVKESQRQVHPERSSTVADMNAQLREKQLEKEAKEQEKIEQIEHQEQLEMHGEPKEVKVCQPVSLMTCYEERLVRKTVGMKHWAHKQEMPIDNSSIYLLGDHADIKSSLLRNVAEMQLSEQVAYVPAVECLPTIYTPRELLVNVAACHGVEISNEFIKYILEVFDMEHLIDFPICELADSDRRILTLLSKLILNPTILIFDQLDVHLPHAKMMTVWSLCARLRHEGVGVIFASHQNNFAEHTATSCAHMHKGTFFAAEAPSSLKAERRCLIVDVVPARGVKTETLLKMIEMAINETVELPTTSKKVSIRVQGDDFPTLEMIIGVLGSFQKQVLRSSIRSISFDEYIACAFESTVVKEKKHHEEVKSVPSPDAATQNGSDAPNAPNAPNDAIAPDAPTASGASDAPNVSVAPVASDAPSAPSAPGAQDAPNAQNAPNAPSAPIISQPLPSLK